MTKSKCKIVAMIPARMGSTRLAKKNLALLNGKPMIYYAIAAAKQAEIFDAIILNSENEVFAEIAKRYGVSFYQRPSKLGGSEIKSDDVVYDFMQQNPSDITAWINPTSPLQTGAEVKRVIDYFCQENLDSLITVANEQVHCLYDGKPLNFSKDDIFAKTQDLIPVQRFVYSIMMWRNKIFIDQYKKTGQAFFCGQNGYFPVSKESAIIVKTEGDFCLVDAILSCKDDKQHQPLTYDEVVK